MKTLTTVITIVLLGLTSPGALGQEGDIFGAIMEAAAAQENAANQAESEANNAAQSEAAAAWQEAWDNETGEYSEFLDAMDTRHLKSVALMILYVDAYLKLTNEHRLGDMILKECDVYSMELLLMASSTTIIYGPEEIAKMTPDQLKQVADDFNLKIAEFIGVDVASLMKEESENAIDSALSENDLWRAVIQKWGYIKQSAAEFWLNNQDNLGLENDYDHPGAGPSEFWVLYLTEFFAPRFIIPRTLEIGKKMEALGCN